MKKKLKVHRKGRKVNIRRGEGNCGDEKGVDGRKTSKRWGKLTMERYQNFFFGDKKFK